MTESTETKTEPTGDIVARGDTWYRGKMFIMTLALLAYCGGYFLYDGFVGYPQNNRKIDELNVKIDATKDEAEKKRLTDEKFKLGNRKSDADILLQKGIGFVSIPLGLWVGFNSYRKSRGEIRLSGETIHVPGHPPITFDAITSIDQRLWDKKGIAYINYSLPEGKNGKFTLDDYIYQRKPIDIMYDRIVAYVSPPEEEDQQEPVQRTEKDERI